MAVLDHIFKQLMLLDTDRAALRRKRGFTDDQIDEMGVGSTGSHMRDVIVKASVKFGVDVCLEAGLMINTRGGAKPWQRYLDAQNVIIPYVTDDACTMLRPHKFTPPGQQPQVYFVRDRYDGQKVTVGAESEFKAEAAEAYGWQAFGIPGISSFSSAGFETLMAQLRARGIRNVVWLFDNEDKSSPESPRFKKLARQRWDTPFYAAVMARQCAEAKDPISARVAWIPDRYRGADYKADIDGMLAAAVPAADFAAIVNAATTPQAFIDSLPVEAGAVIAKRMIKRFEESGRKRLMKSGGRYLWDTEDGPREVSNFIMEYVATLVAGDGMRQYELRLTNVNGQEAVIRAARRECADARKFRELAIGPGLYWWSGKDDSLQEALDDAVPVEEKLVYIRERSVGWDEDLQHYFFTNCVVDSNGAVVEYQADGSVAIDGKLWRMADSGGDLPELHFAASGTATDAKERANVARLLVENFGIEDVVLAFAWFCGTALKPWLFPINGTWPILFVFGRHNSGKSRLMRWLSRIFFNREKGAPEVLLGQVSGPFVRNWATQTPYLPFLGDEFRNDDRVGKHLDMLRGIFDHSSAGISGGVIGTNKQFNLTCALMLVGEDVPNDETGALNERMVTVRLRDTPTSKHFHLLEQLQHGFDGIFVGLLREREKLVAMIRAEYDRLVELYRQRTSSRVAINYALVCAVAKVALGWAVSDDLIDRLFTTIRTEEADTNPIVEMLSACGDHWPAIGDTRLKHALEAKWDAEVGRVVLFFNAPRCWSAYAVVQGRTRAKALAERTMRRLINGCKWIDKMAYVVRIGGWPSGAYRVDLDGAPPEVQRVAYAVADDVPRTLLVARYGNDEGSLAGVEELPAL